MPKIVIKKDGRQEEFIPEKIIVSTMKSGAPLDTARAITKKIEKDVKDEMTTSEIRTIVLNELRKKNEDWHKRWLAYDKGTKRLYQRFHEGLYDE